MVDEQRFQYLVSYSPQEGKTEYLLVESQSELNQHAITDEFSKRFKWVEVKSIQEVEDLFVDHLHRFGVRIKQLKTLEGKIEL